MHAVTGAYAKPIFVDKLGASLVWCVLYTNIFILDRWKLKYILDSSNKIPLIAIPISLFLFGSWLSIFGKMFDNPFNFYVLEIVLKL